jgi:hypothetical protein
VDLLTRLDVKSDFASDVCVRKAVFPLEQFTPREG